LDELRAFTENEANRDPAIVRQVLLRTPGCSDEEIRQLCGFEPNLPPIYIKCIATLSLKGISLSGFFRLWPGGNVFKGTFVEDFQAANSPGWYHQREFAGMGLLRVASWNDADICVAKIASPSFATDSVLRFGDADRVANPTVLCRDFEQFLVAAGNVAEIFVKEKETAAEGRIEMLLDRLRSIGLTRTEIEKWRDIAEVTYQETGT
jgi:hypothetical protein